LNDRWKTIWAFLLIPVKLLFLPTKLIGVFYFRGLRSGNRKRRPKSLRDRAKFWWADAVKLPYRLVTTALHRSRRGELVYLIPAMVAVMFVGYVSFQLSVHSQNIQTLYNQGARQALLEGNLTLANTYFGRLFERSSLSDAQLLQWVAVLRSAGQTQRAEHLLEELAPSEGRGYPEAHAVRALEIAAKIDAWRSAGDGQLKRESLDVAWVKSPDLVDVDQSLVQLRNHLQFANDDDPRMHLAWAKYWFCRGDIVEACQRLELAKRSREMLLEVAKTASQRLDSHKLADSDFEMLDAIRRSSLDEARAVYENQLNADPLNHKARIQLAAALVKQASFKLAKQTLQTGIDFQADPELRRGLADVFVIEYQNDQAFSAERLNRQQLEFRVAQLKQAIAADPDYLLPYVCLAKLLTEKDQPDVAFSKSLESKKADEDVTIQTYRWLVTSDQPSAIDHLGLATLHWQRGDSIGAELHLDQAWAISPDFAGIAHRFAIAIAFFSKRPNLQWARKLVDRSLENRADDPAVLLSHGRILLEQGEVELAVDQLLRALENSNYPEEVHEALQAGYVRMGNLVLAEEHARQARVARTRRAVRAFK
jgi:Tfp pilus assembly protein PilF